MVETPNAAHFEKLFPNIIVFGTNYEVKITPTGKQPRIFCVSFSRPLTNRYGF